MDMPELMFTNRFPPFSSYYNGGHIHMYIHNQVATLFHIGILVAMPYMKSVFR
jgi:hypothetical protein